MHLKTITTAHIGNLSRSLKQQINHKIMHNCLLAFGVSYVSEAWQTFVIKVLSLLFLEIPTINESVYNHTYFFFLKANNV